MTQKLTTIGFDADDTLWQNERFFQMTQERFADLLRDHAEADHLSERLLAAERRNIGRYGYGIKGFVLSMIETALEVTNNDVPGTVIDKTKPLFDGIEIVSDKTTAVYHSIFKRHGHGPGQGMMIGNSMKSDVVPMIDAGGWGIYVPGQTTWALEYAEPPEGSDRFRHIATLSDLPGIVDAIG